MTDEGKVNLVDSGKLQCGQLTGNGEGVTDGYWCPNVVLSRQVRHSCVLDEPKFSVKGWISKHINEFFM